MEQSRKVLQDILKSDNIEQATGERLNEVDEFFVEALNSELEKARQQGDLDRLGQIEQIVDVLQQLVLPRQMALLEELLDTESEVDRRKLLDEHQEVSPPTC